MGAHFLELVVRGRGLGDSGEHHHNPFVQEAMRQFGERRLIAEVLRHVDDVAEITVRTGDDRGEQQAGAAVLRDDDRHGFAAARAIPKVRRWRAMLGREHAPHRPVRRTGAAER